MPGVVRAQEFDLIASAPFRRSTSSDDDLHDTDGTVHGPMAVLDRRAYSQNPENVIGPQGQIIDDGIAVRATRDESSSKENLNSMRGRSDRAASASTIVESDLAELQPLSSGSRKRSLPGATRTGLLLAQRMDLEPAGGTSCWPICR